MSELKEKINKLLPDITDRQEVKLLQLIDEYCYNEIEFWHNRARKWRKVAEDLDAELLRKDTE